MLATVFMASRGKLAGDLLIRLKDVMNTRDRVIDGGNLGRRLAGSGPRADGRERHIAAGSSLAIAS